MDEPRVDPKVTLKVIARRLGLSPATVSLALHQHPKIPEPRRQQIQQAAREMGYLPNVTAVALSQHRRHAKERHTQPVLAWVDAEPAPAGGFPAPDLAIYRHAILRGRQARLPSWKRSPSPTKDGTRRWWIACVSATSPARCSRRAGRS